MDACVVCGHVNKKDCSSPRFFASCPSHGPLCVSCQDEAGGYWNSYLACPICGSSLEDHGYGERGWIPLPGYLILNSLRETPAPRYPRKAAEEGVSGTVVVCVTFDRKGIPLEVKAIEGPVPLRKAAESAAMKVRIKPFVDFGESRPKSVTARVAYLFSLGDEGGKPRAWAWRGPKK